MTQPELSTSDLALLVVNNIVSRARDLGLTWILRPATISSGSDPTNIGATYDGDTVVISMTSIIGVIETDARVYAIEVPSVGHFVVGYVGELPSILLAPGYVTQGFNQDVTSSIVLQDSTLTVPVNGLSQIDLSARYTSLAGGIRWAWSTSGSITTLDRAILSAGQSTSTTATTANIADMRLRTIVTITEEQTSAHFTTSATQLIKEWLIVEGTGSVTFRFAQQTSSASATTLMAQTNAIITRLRAF